jgi:hypothetical protein
MRVVFVGPASPVVFGREPTHSVAISEYSLGDQPLDDIPCGPGTKGLGEYPLAHARDIANDEACRLGLPLVDLTVTPQIA